MNVYDNVAITRTDVYDNVVNVYDNFGEDELDILGALGLCTHSF